MREPRRTIRDGGTIGTPKSCASVSAFVAHGVFPREAWKRFARGGDRDVFDTFYVTNSIPTTTDKLPSDDVFEVIDLTERVIDDLDNY